MKKNERKEWLEWQKKVIREEYVTDEDINERARVYARSYRMVWSR